MIRRRRRRRRCHHRHSNSDVLPAQSFTAEQRYGSPLSMTDKKHSFIHSFNHSSNRPSIHPSISLSIRQFIHSNFDLLNRTVDVRILYLLTEFQNGYKIQNACNMLRCVWHVAFFLFLSVVPSPNFAQFYLKFLLLLFLNFVAAAAAAAAVVTPICSHHTQHVIHLN